MRCGRFGSRRPGRCLAGFSLVYTFHLELGSLCEEVVALGYAAGRPSDSAPPPCPARPCVRARAPGGVRWHLPAHIRPCLCLPPSPRQLRNGPRPFLGQGRAEPGAEGRATGWQGRGARGRGVGFPVLPLASKAAVSSFHLVALALFS